MVFPLVALFIVLADQLSKAWIRDSISFGQTLFDIGFLRIVRTHNTGAAFGIFQGYSFALIIVACVGIILLIACVILSCRYLPFLDNVPSKVALGLILGGTTGNLIDRLYFGYVTDFIDFKFWPAFNVADSTVNIGVITILVYLLFQQTWTEKRQDG